MPRPLPSPPGRLPQPRAVAFGPLSALLAVAVLVAGCGFFSTPPQPTGPGPSGSGAVTERPGPPTPAPTATPNHVKSIVLIGAIGESAPGTPSYLAWQGVQDAGKKLGAGVTIVNPMSPAELTAAVPDAAGASVVVTVDPAAGPAVMAAAAEHPATHFFELDQTVPAGAPENVHGIVFDEPEIGYLAGFVAASLTTSGRIGLVGDAKADVRTANYEAGFRAGAAEANAEVAVSVAYAGRSNDPQKGRAASAGLVKAGADEVAAMADLSGDGALRDACARKAGVIGLDRDAALALPDVEPCLAVSVLKRYDVAVRDAILHYAVEGKAPASTVSDVTGGGIALSDFRAVEPPQLKDRLAAVLAAMEAGPPRSTPTPSPAPSSAPTT
jgi:basic membrane protein A and related proteins